MAFSASVVCAAMLFTGCGDDAPASDDAAPSSVGPGDVVDSDNMVERERVVASAIDIRADGCGPRSRFGTGTLVDGGVVVTAAHVVAGSDAVEVIDTDGARSAAEVVAFDPDLDIALLRPATPIGSPAELRTEPARTDEQGLAVFPREVDGVVEIDIVQVTVLRPVSINTTDIYLDDDVERAGFELDASIEPGNSGAMVHLPGGGVGVIWARSNQRDDRAWAVSLPDQLRDADQLASLDAAVDTGECTTT